MPLETPSSSPNQRRHPFLHRNENIRHSFDNQSLSERVRQVLDFMKSVNINFPILLWAISWNIPEPIPDPKVSAERTALMLSDESWLIGDDRLGDTILASVPEPLISR